MRGDRHPYERSWRHDPRTGRPGRVSGRRLGKAAPGRGSPCATWRPSTPSAAARREAHGIASRPLLRARWLQGLHGWGVAEGRRQEGLVRHRIEDVAMVGTVRYHHFTARRMELPHRCWESQCELESAHAFQPSRLPNGGNYRGNELPPSSGDKESQAWQSLAAPPGASGSE